MRYYTKEWHELLQSIGTAELFEPVIDKTYSDEDIELLYQTMMDKFVREAQEEYDTPPFIDTEDIIEEDFDPEDYLIADIDENGNEVGLRHPASACELAEYRARELEYEMNEYENRAPFDAEEYIEEFRQDYEDNLAEPDTDIPEWIIDTVDPRLTALWLLPEGAYKRLLAEEKEKQARFDELDDAASDSLEEMYQMLPDDYVNLPDDFDCLDGDYVTELCSSEDGLEIRLAGFDEDGCEVCRSIIFEEPEIIEDEGLHIMAERDEDGDIITNCYLLEHELYFEDERPEIHMMFENDGLKYMTLSCGALYIETGRAE